MNKKWVKTMVFLLLVIMVMSSQAFAMKSVTAEIPFTVENTSGTVVIEAVGNAPLPAQTELSEVTEGKFELTFTQPGDYYYKIYQKPGTEPDVIYNDIIYDVIVSVFVNEKDGLYTVVTVAVPGDSHKPERIVFTNTISELDLGLPGNHIDESPAGNDGMFAETSAAGWGTSSVADNTPQTGDDGSIHMWIMPMLVSLLGLIACYAARKKK